MLDQGSALRTTAAQNLHEVFHVAADLFQRFGELVGGHVASEQAVHPFEIDIDNRHFKASLRSRLQGICRAGRASPAGGEAITGRPDLNPATRDTKPNRAE